MRSKERQNADRCYEQKEDGGSFWWSASLKPSFIGRRLVFHIIIWILRLWRGWRVSVIVGLVEIPALSQENLLQGSFQFCPRVQGSLPHGVFLLAPPAHLQPARCNLRCSCTIHQKQDQGGLPVTLAALLINIVKLLEEGVFLEIVLKTIFLFFRDC